MKFGGIMKNSTKKKTNWKEHIRRFLFITLLLSIIYIITRIAVSPSEAASVENYEKLKSDYVLMLIQCFLGLVVMMIPSIIERRRAIDIPDSMEILYFVFLYLAIYLGEVRNFYYLVPHWDTILHAFSGGMLGAMGFSLVNLLNKSDRVQFDLSPFFIALFAFCFALAAGAIWEIYEYTVDATLGLNMQKFALADGTQLVGHGALSDTMYDFIVDALSALIISILGYYSIKNPKRKENEKK
jgi:hypothetical protein